MGTEKSKLWFDDGGNASWPMAAREHEMKRMWKMGERLYARAVKRLREIGDSQ